MSDIAIRVEHLEESDSERKSKLEEVENRLDAHSSEIQRLAIWRDGNGAKGAEARLQCVEEKLEDLPAIKSDLAVVKLVADAKLSSIEDAVGRALDRRDKTVLAYLTKLGPFAAAIAAIIVAIWGKA
ncbi:MAG: hypothetical protein WC455_13990 [Dehalococcoidia bacterium]|jgi:DNA repair exonuclease SbcCD ATPase subunit